MKTKGFTLVELLVVIAILAILATVSVVGYTSFIDRAEVSNAETEAHQIESTINSFLMIDEEFVFSDTTNATTAGTYEKIYAVKEDGEVVVKKAVVTVTVTDGKATVSVAEGANYTGDVAKTTDFAELPGTLKAAAGVLKYYYTTTDSVDVFAD